MSQGPDAETTPFLDLELARWLEKVDRLALLRVCHALERECFGRGYHQAGKLLSDAHKELAQEGLDRGQRESRQVAAVRAMIETRRARKRLPREAKKERGT